MKIKVDRVTSLDTVHWACAVTLGKESNISLAEIYECEHSPARVILFKIDLISIPTFVSTHLVRHQIGVSHFVRSNRKDRSSHSGDTGRMHPVNHSMFINAQALMNMARKRLCYKASKETREVMEAIRDAVKLVDFDLAERMVPECIYRGGICHEAVPCGKMTLRHGGINETIL